MLVGYFGFLLDKLKLRTFNMQNKNLKYLLLERGKLYKITYMLDGVMKSDTLRYEDTHYNTSNMSKTYIMYDSSNNFHEFNTNDIFIDDIEEITNVN
jgi:hypothetical protein